MLDFGESPYGSIKQPRSPFPVRPLERRSYAQNCVVWIKPAGLQVIKVDFHENRHYDKYNLPW